MQVFCSALSSCLGTGRRCRYSQKLQASFAVSRLVVTAVACCATHCACCELLGVCVVQEERRRAAAVQAAAAVAAEDRKDQ